MSSFNIDYYNPEYDETPRVGTVGFLVENSHNTKGYANFTLRDTPPRTNQSHEIRVHGWCGTYNDLATYGKGIARIVRVFKNGRVKIEVMTRDTDEADFAVKATEFETIIREFLEETGFDDLNWLGA